MSARPTLIAAGPERRNLAVVAFLDVVNYTAMMAEQEARTHALWMSLLEELIYPSIAEHDGVAVKSLGDGVLARFGSALNAVEWADRLQQATRARQTSLEQVMPYIELRVSIHSGEVILTPTDVFGECVNFAARILEHASPGGVVMSQAVYDMVRTSAGARAKDIGFHKLKSYDRPVRLYQLEPEVSTTSRRKTPASSAPSIAILPLTEVGPNRPDDYFAEGVVEDVVVSLAGLGDMLVVSRGSTLSFRGVDADPREVGRVLGVQYVVTGTLQRRPDLIRVSWQLCTTDNGIALWTATAEAAPNDLFALQDRIVTRIVAGIAPKVRASELRRIMRKRPESFNAYDHMLRGLHLLHRLELGDNQSAYECFEAAMTEDPTFGMPFAWAAFSQVLRWGRELRPIRRQPSRKPGASRLAPSSWTDPMLWRSRSMAMSSRICCTSMRLVCSTSTGRWLLGQVTHRRGPSLPFRSPILDIASRLSFMPAMRCVSRCSIRISSSFTAISASPSMEQANSQRRHAGVGSVWKRTRVSRPTCGCWRQAW